MDRLMTAKEIGGILNVSARTVRRMAEARVIPGVRRIGHLWRFDPKKFMKWLADLEVPEDQHENADARFVEKVAVDENTRSSVT